MKSFPLRHICVPLCLFVSFAFFSWYLQTAGAETKNGITLQARELSLRDILKKISDISGYEIIAKGDTDSRISVSLKDASLEQAFVQILRKSNYAIIWDEDGKKIILSLYSSSAAVSPLPEIGIQGNAEKSRSGRPEDIREIFRSPESGINIKNRHDETISHVLSGQGTRFVQTSRTTAE